LVGDRAGDAEPLLLAAGEAERAFMQPVLDLIPEGGGLEAALGGLVEFGAVRTPATRRL
jgi:hypothetical protein